MQFTLTPSLLLIHPRSGNRFHPSSPALHLTLHLSRRVSRRGVRVFESPFTVRLAEGRGVNEEPQVARKGRPFAPDGNSIRRPVDPAVGRDFHGVTRFPADITFDIYEAPVEVRSATVDWNYALTLRG